MAESSLDIFDKLTKSWFIKTLGKPTAVQEEAWPAIAAGNHTLVSAPTGTGKTLSAFLVFIDRLLTELRTGSLKNELQLIYVSPLKSLAGDIRENLRRPLSGILEEERLAGVQVKGAALNLKIAIRTGDTSQNERRSMIKTPPHILITTPESLYLMLTSKTGKKMLSTAKAIIIDELHAIIDSKRGAHLMLSIARLDKLCGRPLQRIGLSATIRPLELAAGYLAPEPVTIVAPRMKKDIRLEVTSPKLESFFVQKNHIWHELARKIYDLCQNSRSVIAFVDGRAYAERLAYFVNLIGGEGFARTHHGSLSKEQRLEVEQALRDGELKLLVATSSMELGIDVGDIDMVFQIGCPRSIASTLQRLGRAGHNPGRTSIMHILPRFASEGLFCGLTAEIVRRGEIEDIHPPRLCLDVLAQHLVSMACDGGYHIDDLMEILPRAYPFAEVTKEDIKELLAMLAGDYEHERNIPVRPRLLYDRIHEWVEGDTYSRMLAISAAGTIPDKGLFAVKTENGVKLGELDEEFVFEAHVGDKFLLGSFAWQITYIGKDTVVVRQSNSYGAQAPFYKAEIIGRKLQTGIAFGKLLRQLGKSYHEGSLMDELAGLGLDERTASEVADFIGRQMEATELLPDDRTIIVEHFSDESSSHQLMVHSVFGRKVNAPLAILAREAAKKHVKTNIICYDDDDGFLLFPYGDCEMPEGLLHRIDPGSARAILEAVLPATPVFNMTFRYNLGRALMMGAKKSGRQPLWLQRLRSAQTLDSLIAYKNHPLIRETRRECLEDVWDLQGVEYVLKGIRNGTIQVREIYTDAPSPLSLPLRNQTEATLMYDYSPTPAGITVATEEALKEVQMLPPDAEQLAFVSERRRLPEDEKQLHSLLMIEGDLIAGELQVPIDWLELLAKREQALYIEPGLWIAAEHLPKYQAALEEGDYEARKQIVLRLIRYRGAQTAESISERYLWEPELACKILEELERQGSIVESEGLYYHAELYERARRESIKSRRAQIKTRPAERYAALMAKRLQASAPAQELLEKAIRLLTDKAIPAENWESLILPARIANYRPEMLDNMLAGGNFFWRMNEDQSLCFGRYEDIDWDADMGLVAQTLEGNERIIYEALLKRGASFMQSLTGLLEDELPYDVLGRLTGKGLVCADSFLPVRQLLSKEALQKVQAKRRAYVRAKAMTTGRYEIVRPLKELSTEELLEREFDRSIIICRETIESLPWARALETLRVWEYTGRVRRGYFIDGLSGIQFIRDRDFARVMQELEEPGGDLVWIPAADPFQIWGKTLKHMPDRGFMNVAQTVVALYEGRPVAVMERQGKVLRVFEDDILSEALALFVKAFNKKQIYPSVNRITIKQYPESAAGQLVRAGFRKELQDYVLYRSSF